MEAILPRTSPENDPSPRATSYEEAVARGAMFYWSSAPCSHGHIGARYTRSRGCYECNTLRSREWRTANPERVKANNRRHAGAKTPTYVSWRAMNNRCHNPRATQWPRYGGKGVTVCQRWRGSFENFVADMGERPSLKHSIDRFPDGSGNYEPGNCRWATAREQQNNKSSNRLVIYNGVSTTVAEAKRAAKSAIPKTTILQRLNRGWTIEAALTIVPQMGRNQWSEDYGTQAR